MARHRHSSYSSSVRTSRWCPRSQALVRSSNSLTARFHALWTLEGLDALDAGLVREQLKDPNPRMRVQAIRASETLYKAANRSFADDYRAMTKDSDSDVALQAMLTANLFKLPNVEALIKDTQALEGEGHPGDRPPAADSASPTPRTAATLLSPAQQEQLKEGDTVPQDLCFSCHGDDGRGVAMAGAAEGAMMAPPLAGSPRVLGHRDYVISTLLHGMTGPIAGQVYAGQVMLPMGAQNDQWIANITSYVRNSFGNTGSFVSPAEVARVRAATAARKTPWTFAELEAALPRLLPADPSWKATAQPQRRKSRQRPDARRLDDGGSAATGDVVPGRTATAGNGRRGAVRRRRAAAAEGWAAGAASAVRVPPRAEERPHRRPAGAAGRHRHHRRRGEVRRRRSSAASLSATVFRCRATEDVGRPGRGRQGIAGDDGGHVPSGPGANSSE